MVPYGPDPLPHLPPLVAVVDGGPERPGEPGQGEVVQGGHEAEVADALEVEKCRLAWKCASTNIRCLARYWLTVLPGTDCMIVLPARYKFTILTGRGKMLYLIEVSYLPGGRGQHFYFAG